jgi:hypothetical protein
VVRKGSGSLGCLAPISEVLSGGQEKDLRSLIPPTHRQRGRAPRCPLQCLPAQCRPWQKIDAAAALIMAHGRAIGGEGSSLDRDAFRADPLFM